MRLSHFLMLIILCAAGTGCTLITKQVDGEIERHVSFGVFGHRTLTGNVAVIDEKYVGVYLSENSLRIGSGVRQLISVDKTSCALIVIFDEVPKLEPEWLTVLRTQKSAGICVVNQRGEK